MCMFGYKDKKKKKEKGKKIDCFCVESKKSIFLFKNLSKFLLTYIQTNLMKY